MARRRMKGGENDFIETMVASGVGAYAAKNSTSMGGLLWTLAKYALVIFAVILAVTLVLRLLGIKKEHFVPVAPSASGDKKEVTPSGNVILY